MKYYRIDREIEPHIIGVVTAESEDEALEKADSEDKEFTPYWNPCMQQAIDTATEIPKDEYDATKKICEGR